MNHIERWMEEDGIRMIRPRVIPNAVYIRFGKWGRRHRSYNFSTFEAEKGLSVYRARMTPDGHVALDDCHDLRVTPEDYAEALNGRLAFVVTGREVGRGSDGEPVLVSVKMLPYAIDYSSIPIKIKTR